MTSGASAAASGAAGANPDGPRSLLDEALALRVARLVTPRRRTAPDEVAALRAEVDADLPRIDEAARRWTQLGGDLPPVSIRVVGRTGWVRANLAAIRGTFEPLRERLEKRPGAEKVLAAQVGGLFGLLSVKVLGQYILPLGGPGGGQLVLVGPNVLDLADRHGSLATDIRRAIVLHEVTHWLQFGATPWLGDHLRTLVDRYLQEARTQHLPLAELAPRIPELVEEIRRTGSIQPLLGAVLTPAQLEVLEEAQGLMSLLEGHGNAAMYSAAPADLIADPEGVREALARRHGDVTSKVLSAIAGLEMKRRQYREGETFVREVIARGGMDALNRAFTAPDHLPVATEVADPQGWLARVQAA